LSRWGEMLWANAGQIDGAMINGLNSTA
jgi:hypothetical protein